MFSFDFYSTKCNVNHYSAKLKRNKIESKSGDAAVSN